MSREDLELEIEEVEKLIIETYRNERESDEYISDGRLTAIASAITNLLKQREVELLESLLDKIIKDNNGYQPASAETIQKLIDERMVGKK